jgi:ketosteroid isomerase-like protein
MTVDYATGGDLLEAFGRAWAAFDGDAWVALFTEDAAFHGDPFSPPLMGHNAIRAFLLASAEEQEQVEFTVERHWVSGSTVLGAWHASYVRRATRERVRLSGFMTLDVAVDGRIARLHDWWMAPRSVGAED